MSSRSDVQVVGIIQSFVPTYRVPFFDALSARLTGEGMRLEVWHGKPRGRVAARGNSTTGTWSVPVSQHRLSIGRRNVTFRAVHRRARAATVVIAGLASTNLETFGLAADPSVRLMLWGHGRNFTAHNNRIDELVESSLRRRSLHLFTYTERGKTHLVERGAKEEKITVVQNSTDTRGLQNFKAALPEDTAESLRSEYRLQSFVGLFVGAFDKPKKLPLLFSAADQVYRARPDFVLLLAGAGPEQEAVRRAAQSRPYIRLIGRVTPEQLARLSSVVSMILIPGRVGLVAVDALALGVPIVTTNYPFHAPEADYLTPGENSIWTDFSIDAYAEGILTLIQDEAAIRRLSKSALRRAEGISVEESADRFTEGILRGLNR